MSDTFDWVMTFLTSLNTSAQTMQAVANAYNNPTLDNIKNAEQSYRTDGQEMPAKIREMLYGRYVQYIADNPLSQIGSGTQVLKEWFPWIAAGVLLVMINKKRRKKRR
jgi:ribonucleotide reductase beta subunit family protein with ferritin-like domain